MVEFRAEYLVAGQYDVIAGHPQWRHVGSGDAGVGHRPQGIGVDVLLYLIHPLHQDDLGAHYQSGLAGEGLEREGGRS